MESNGYYSLVESSLKSNPARTWLESINIILKHE